jgi:hypothetical protein
MLKSSEITRVVRDLDVLEVSQSEVTVVRGPVRGGRGCSLER